MRPRQAYPTFKRAFSIFNLKLFLKSMTNVRRRKPMMLKLSCCLLSTLASRKNSLLKKKMLRNVQKSCFSSLKSCLFQRNMKRMMNLKKRKAAQCFLSILATQKNLMLKKTIQKSQFSVQKSKNFSWIGPVSSYVSAFYFRTNALAHAQKQVSLSSTQLSQPPTVS